MGSRKGLPFLGVYEGIHHHISKISNKKISMERSQALAADFLISCFIRLSGPPNRQELYLNHVRIRDVLTTLGFILPPAPFILPFL